MRSSASIAIKKNETVVLQEKKEQKEKEQKEIDLSALEIEDGPIIQLFYTSVDLMSFYLTKCQQDNETNNVIKQLIEQANYLYSSMQISTTTRKLVEKTYYELLKKTNEQLGEVSNNAKISKDCCANISVLKQRLDEQIRGLLPIQDYKQNANLIVTTQNDTEKTTQLISLIKEQQALLETQHFSLVVDALIKKMQGINITNKKCLSSIIDALCFFENMLENTKPKKENDEETWEVVSHSDMTSPKEDAFVNLTLTDDWDETESKLTNDRDETASKLADEWGDAASKLADNWDDAVPNEYQKQKETAMEKITGIVQRLQKLLEQPAHADLQQLYNWLDYAEHFSELRGFNCKIILRAVSHKQVNHSDKAASQRLNALRGKIYTQNKNHEVNNDGVDVVISLRTIGLFSPSSRISGLPDQVGSNELLNSTDSNNLQERIVSIRKA